MPDSKPPTINDDTPGHATVYIKSPVSGAVGECTVDQYRDLYKAQDWTVTTPEAHAEHMEKLAGEHRDMQINRRELLYPPDGATAAQRATSRSTSSKEG